jgi:hypothetical protein
MLQKVASNLENYGFGTKDIAPIGTNFVCKIGFVKKEQKIFVFKA